MYVWYRVCTTLSRVRNTSAQCEHNRHNAENETGSIFNSDKYSGFKTEITISTTPTIAITIVKRAERKTTLAATTQ